MESTSSVPPVPQDWRARLEPYQKSENLVASWQVLSTTLACAATWWVTYHLTGTSYPLAVMTAPLAAGCVLRLFMLTIHDAGHESLFRSRRVNRVVGTVFGFLLWYPFEDWRYYHAQHHSISGNLDAREKDVVFDYTLEEFERLPAPVRRRFVFLRHPITMFVLAMAAFFSKLVPPSTRHRAKVRRNIVFTQLVIVVSGAVASIALGPARFLITHITILTMAYTAGAWLMLIQHNFKGCYRARESEWEFAKAGLYGSSHYHLPQPLRWFTGNIGFHHIHHLNPRIPNYRLEACQRANGSLFVNVRTLTIADGFSSAWLCLWDERRQELIRPPEPAP